MRTVLLIGWAAIVTGSFARCTNPPPATQPTPTNATLYQRVGGYDALASVTGVFLAKMLGDPSIEAFFADLDEFGKKRVRQMIVDQLCAATGGPCVYVGLDMRTAHEDLEITKADWGTAVKYLVATLEEHRVPVQEKDELLAIVSSLENDIVTQD